MPVGGLAARLIARAQPRRTFATEYDRRANSFTITRLVLAVLVLYSHSFAISGVGYQDQLQSTIGVTAGGFAVIAFFIVSGFLVTQSLDSTRSQWRLLAFLAKRFLRVMPGLIVCTVAVAFVLGAICGGRGPRAYFSFQGGWSPWWYSFDTLTLNLFGQVLGWHARLRDAFVTNPMSATVNGSLWSLRFEVAAYVILGLVASLVRYRPRLYSSLLAVLGFISVVALWTGLKSLPLPAPWVLAEWETFVSIVPYFFMGSAIYTFRRNIPYSGRLAALLAMVAVLSSSSSLHDVVWVLAFPYCILVAGTSRTFAWFDKHLGDYSYGTYIYAFPIQQTVLAVMGGHDPYALFALSLPITLVVAHVSWNLVERPALSLKSRSRRVSGPEQLAAVPA